MSVRILSSPRRWPFLVAALAGLALSSGVPAAKAQTPPPVASVNGQAIDLDSYSQTLTLRARDRFYHGRPPEAELAALRIEVLRDMIDRILFAEEIARRKLKPDAAAVDAELERYERQYGNSPQWQHGRERLLPGLRGELERRNLEARLREVVTEVPAPTGREVEAFYRQRSELFTEPARVRASVILLAVDPSSPAAVWQAVMEEGQRIRAEIDKGTPFAELARRHSMHESAERGGDLGYLHGGMLSGDADELIEKMAVGEVSPAFRVLEGVMIIRIDNRVPAKLRDFADVRARAKELLLRDRQEAAWEALRERLYRQAKVTVDVERYPELKGFPLPGERKGG
jgi:parvulin-like peptidyl-prolyl isomerase